MEGNLTVHSTIEAVVHRADGTIEDLGVIADSDWGTVTAEEKPSLKERLRRILNG
jgi:hypothetical protein